MPTADHVELVLKLQHPSKHEEAARDLQKVEGRQYASRINTCRATHPQSAEDRVQADIGVALKAGLILDRAEHLAEDTGRLVRLPAE